MLLQHEECHLIIDEKGTRWFKALLNPVENLRCKFKKVMAVDQ